MVSNLPIGTNYKKINQEINMATAQNIYKTNILNFVRKIDNLIFDNIGPIRILFIINNNLSMTSLFPIINEIQNHNNIKIAITEEFDGCFNCEAKDEAVELFHKFYIKPSYAIFKKWHYTFSTDFVELWLKRNTTHVFINHGSANGSSDKLIENVDEYMKNLILKGNHSLYFCNSYADYEDMNGFKMNAECINSKQLFISGFAKIDPLFNCTKHQSEIFLQSLNCDPDNKTIVIGSHWKSKSLFKTLGSNFIKTICSIGPEFNILVMGHGNLWADKSSNLFSEIKELEKKFPNLHFLPDLNSTKELLKSGDIFIGDNSSIFIEYCLMDKPILFFNHPDFIFLDEYVGELYKNASSSFSNEQNIIALIKSSLEKPTEKQHQRKIVVEHFLARMGSSTRYIVDIIKQLGRISGPSSSKWQKVIDLSRSELSKFRQNSK